MMLSALIRFPLIFISGIFTPLASLPDGARLLSMFSPLSYLSDGLDATMGQASVVPLLVDVLVLLGFTAVFLFAASAILKRKALKGL